MGPTEGVAFEGLRKIASSRPDLDDALRSFIEAQPVFFVGSAPLGGEGRVNVSPKGLDTLRVLSSTEVAYVDLGGSGNETSAHLLENGRLTLMFCAFEGSPRIVRLYGRGRVVMRQDADWAELASRFGAFPGARQIVVLRIERVGVSCGYGVPLMRLEGPRPILAAKRCAADARPYWREGNEASIDGLPTRAPVTPPSG